MGHHSSHMTSPLGSYPHYAWQPPASWNSCRDPYRRLASVQATDTERWHLEMLDSEKDYQKNCLNVRYSDVFWAWTVDTQVLSFHDAFFTTTIITGLNEELILKSNLTFSLYPTSNVWFRLSALEESSQNCSYFIFYPFVNIQSHIFLLEPRITG